MPLTLYVDGGPWRAALRARCQEMPGLVPVVKGNGYGFGLHRLAAECERLGAPTLAVGSPEEVDEVTAAYGGDVLVMAPWRPGWGAAGPGQQGLQEQRRIWTLGHADSLDALPLADAPPDARPRVVVECLTSMRRHGLRAEELPAVRAALPRLQLEGFALHLPLTRTDGRTNADEVTDWVGVLTRAALPVDTLWVSHLDAAELAGLARRHPGLRLRPRVGTALWLGAPATLRTAATVLDARPLAAGERYGYRQQRVARPSTLLVVSGGTAHGVALEAPRAVRGPVDRARALAVGALGAAGRSLSPFTVAGRQRWFAEPPHMQVSMLLLPARVPAPAVGDEVEVEVRKTTTRFDRVVGL